MTISPAFYVEGCKQPGLERYASPTVLLKRTRPRARVLDARSMSKEKPIPPVGINLRQGGYEKNRKPKARSRFGLSRSRPEKALSFGVGDLNLIGNSLGQCVAYLLDDILLRRDICYAKFDLRSGNCSVDAGRLCQNLSRRYRGHSPNDGGARRNLLRRRREGNRSE
ncbi:hypothetical protein NVIRENTERO_01808 [Sodalis praecaptivus]|nr:hypothetical protein NVIRENTERO_01808 [Sodalis praecaptivus]